MKRLAEALINIIKKLFTADYPYCVYCGEEYGVDAKTLCCAACRDKITDRNIQGEVSGFGYTSGFTFEGPVKELVHRFKYGGAKYLGEKMAFLLNETRTEGFLPDAVVNVPLHRNKRKKRGYDQSEIIARSLAQIRGIPYIPALRRIADTPTQTSLNREQRIENMRGAFEASADVKGKRLLLIDDVLTTGSTVSECARVLVYSGAADVHILTFAKAAD